MEPFKLEDSGDEESQDEEKSCLRESLPTLGELPSSNLFENSSTKSNHGKRRGSENLTYPEEDDEEISFENAFESGKRRRQTIGANISIFEYLCMQDKR